MIIGKRQELDKNYSRICVNNPLFHGYGIIITIMNCLNHSATMILPSPHFNPENSLEAIVKEKCNIVYGTPTSE
jgi:acyl-CoA synthetase (AMP-forming)/AMP-acid ligase II